LGADTVLDCNRIIASGYAVVANLLFVQVSPLKSEFDMGVESPPARDVGEFRAEVQTSHER